MATNRQRFERICNDATTRAECHAMDNANKTTKLGELDYDSITPAQWQEWIICYYGSLEILQD